MILKPVGAFAATITWAGEPDTSMVERMLRAVPHRGSDIKTVITGRAVLGIVEGDAGFAELGQHDRWTCAFLGPLDNAAELAKQLGLAEATPAQVVAAAFARWETGAAGRLRGAFSGVVTDGDVAWAFRDHIGGRPFFFRAAENRWWGATEAKQVVAGSGIPRRPNREALALTYYRGISDESALEGVQRLMHGEVLTVSRSENRRTRHWDPPASILESAHITVDQAQERLVEILDEVISRSVHGQDALALSGGIDSPVVAAFAAPRHLQLAERPIAAYTFVYPDQRTVDESHYTRIVAEALKIDLSEVVPTAGPLDGLDHWIALADGPWDSLPMAVAAQGYQRAADLGATQVLTGTLAEYVYTINPFLLGHLASHGRLRTLADQLLVRRSSGRTWPSLTKQLMKEVTPAPLGKAYSVLSRRRSRTLPPWVDVTGMGGSRYPSVLANPVRQRWGLPTLQAARGTTTTFEAVEICAASVGITVRNPLADRDLWEFFLSLPVEVKFPDTTPKSLVRRAMRGRVPDEILDRRDKTVFDENVLATVPWAGLDRYLADPQDQITGIDYSMLRQRLAGRDLHPAELVWAYDLCAVHAFLETF